MSNPRPLIDERIVSARLALEEAAKMLRTLELSRAQWEMQLAAARRNLEAAQKNLDEAVNARGQTAKNGVLAWPPLTPWYLDPESGGPNPDREEARCSVRRGCA